MESSRFDTYNGRLNSYNNWPPESPFIIKDLVEAGFVHTGQEDSVYCFKCKLIVSGWKEEDKPLEIHAERSKECPYLIERQQKQISNRFTENSEVLQENEDDDLYGSSERNPEDDMVHESNRYRTFATCPVNKHWPPVDVIAKWGFFWIAKNEHMQCFSCAVVVDAWESADQDVALKHRSLSPSCSFMNGNSNSNQAPMSLPSIESELFEAFRNMALRNPVQESDPTPYDQQGKQYNPQNGHVYQPHYSRRLDERVMLTQPTQPPAAHPNYSRLGNNPSPQFTPQIDHLPPHQLLRSQYSSGSSQSEYAERSKRLSTFLTWPKTVPVQPTELCDAGFYYTGRDDSVKCYICECALRQWEPGDTAWGEHRKFSPNCPLVISMIRGNQRTNANARPPVYNTPQMSPQRHPSPFEGGLRGNRQYMEQNHNEMHHSPSVVRMPNHNQANFFQQPTPYPYLQFGQQDLRSNMNPYMNSHQNMNPLLPQYLLENQYLTTSPSACSDQESVLSSSSSEKGLNMPHRYLPPNTANMTPPPRYHDLSPSSSSCGAHMPMMTPPPNYHTLPTNPYFPSTPQESSVESPTNGVRDENNIATNKDPNEEPKLLKTKVNKRVSDGDIDDLLELGIPEQSIRETIACFKSYSPQNFTSRDDLIQAVLHYQKHKTLEGTPYGQKLNVDEDVYDKCSLICDKVNPNEKVKSNEQVKNVVDTEKNCRICLDNDVEVTLIPCGHCCLCVSCTFGLKECPICRKEIENTQRTYFFGN